MITLTDTAANKVRELLDAEGDIDLALRVAVRPGGCSGFSYEMFFDGDITSTLGVLEIGVTPTKSPTVSKGSLVNVEGLTVCEDEWIMMV